MQALIVIRMELVDFDRRLTVKLFMKLGTIGVYIGKFGFENF